MEEQKYKQKYLKYKSKYLMLKYQLINEQKGNGMIDSMIKMTQSIPMGNLMAKTMPMGNMMTQFGIPGMSGVPGMSGNQQQTMMMLQQFVTPQNMQIFSKIVASLFTHILDPRFYPMVALIIKDITFLMGSATTANPIAVMFSLNNALNNMRSTFPKEFMLLKQFFMTNRHKIIPMLQKHNPMLFNDATYEPLVNFIFR